MSDIVEQISNQIKPKIDGLKSLWNQIGYRNEVVDARRSQVLHYFGKLADDMLKEENECKEEIMEDIAESKSEVGKLCRDLGLPSEKPPAGENQSLMAVWDSYQTISTRLKGMRQQRVDKMKTLYDIEYPICKRLGESPMSLVCDDDTPQDKQFVEVEKNIHRLRNLLEERSTEFAKTRTALLELLVDLEVTANTLLEPPSIDFQKSVLAPDAQSVFILSELNMQKLHQWHSDTVKLHSSRKQEIIRLREQIISVGRRLNLPESELAKKALTSKSLLTKCSARLIDELSHNLSALNAEKLRQLPLVVDQTRKELVEAMDRCWMGDLERQRYSSLLTSSECTDELLDKLDTAVAALVELRKENEAIYAAADCWMDLLIKQQLLDEKAADPNRYKNRGGGLLQEEKERKEVASTLPKRERELYSLAADYFSQKGQEILLMGLTPEEFIELKKIEYEDEKLRKRELLKGTQGAGTSTLHSTAKTPGARRQGPPPSASRVITPLTNSTMRSNLRSATKIGASTPNLALSSLRQTPLKTSTRHLNVLHHTDEDVTLGSVAKGSRKRTSGHTVATTSSNHSPPKKRFLETIPADEVPLAPVLTGPKGARKPLASGTSASTRNLRQNLISPARPIANSPSLNNLRAIPSGGTKLASKPTLGTKAKVDLKSNLAAKSKSQNSNATRTLRGGRASASQAGAAKNPATRQQKEKGYPFAAPPTADGTSIIDFNKLPDSFTLGHGSPMHFQNASLDPDSGVLAGHSDTADLHVDSILVAPTKQVPQQPVVSRFAMPPPQLSSTLIAHATRSTANSKR